MAVAVVHHARKGGATLRAGQALRGASEFHAWGDSNIYLRRTRDRLTLTAEHRAAASVAPLDIALKAEHGALALHLEEAGTSTDQTPSAILVDRITEALKTADAPVTFDTLRSACRVRTASLCQALNQLVAAVDVSKCVANYILAGQ